MKKQFIPPSLSILVAILLIFSSEKFDWIVIAFLLVILLSVIGIIVLYRKLKSPQTVSLEVVLPLL